jgi:hypothetical protein
LPQKYNQNTGFGEDSPIKKINPPKPRGLGGLG